jgi:pyridoxine kinase
MDCTALLPDFPTQWTHADVRTEGFLTGFLSDVTQADILRKDVIPQILCKDGILLVDPVLGDDGARYPFVGDDLAVGMRRLASMADILTPNVTELRILAGENNFSQPDFSQAKLLDFLAERVRGIEKKPGAAVVVTGVPAGADILTCIFCADAPQKVLRRKRLPGSYSGTGDLLAALLMGYSLQDRPLSDAVRGAVKFLSRCISDAAARGLPGQGGIPFEQHLRRLL